LRTRPRQRPHDGPTQRRTQIGRKGTPDSSSPQPPRPAEAFVCSTLTPNAGLCSGLFFAEVFRALACRPLQAPCASAPSSLAPLAGSRFVGPGWLAAKRGGTVETLGARTNPMQTATLAVRSLIDVASGSLAKSPVSLSPGDMRRSSCALRFDYAKAPPELGVTGPLQVVWLARPRAAKRIPSLRSIQIE
jgi:hypothetical protein